MAGNGGSTRGRRWLWAGVAVAACGAMVAVWWLPPKLYPADAPEARATLQSGLLTVAAAMVAVVGGLDEVRRANQSTNVRELYLEAVKLLNGADRGMRFAGIYDLERIAVDSSDYQGPVVKVLSAFVREHATPAPAERAAGTVPAPAAGPGTDIQAALAVLGRLPTRENVPRADLVSAHLSGAVLTGAKLAGAVLSHADLTGAVLAGADLTGVLLYEANLAGARLSHADLTGAVLADADLTGAVLAGANLTRARLDEADLTGAVGLTQTQLAAADGNGETKLPEGLARPERWPEQA